MTSPSTELDARFSDPDAEPISWEGTRETIERAQLFWISTVRADGRPHVTPLVAVWLFASFGTTAFPALGVAAVVVAALLVASVRRRAS